LKSYYKKSFENIFIFERQNEDEKSVLTSIHRLPSGKNIKNYLV
jgi:hypothetical protein